MPWELVTVQNTSDANGRVCQQTRGDTGTVRFFYITTDRATLPESLQLLAEAAAGDPISQTPCSALTATTAPVTATVVVDPRGKPTTSRFNGQQYLIQVPDALGQVTTYERQMDTNLLLSITDPLGNLTTFEYDAQGNLTAITSPEENLKPEPERPETRLTHNSYGRVLTATDPLNHTTTFTYTSHGGLETVTDPLGHTTTRMYDEVSRPPHQIPRPAPLVRDRPRSLAPDRLTSNPASG